MWFLIAVIGISPCDVAYGYAEYTKETVEFAIKENKELIVRPTVKELVESKSKKFRVLGKFSNELTPKNGQLYIYEPKYQEECVRCKRGY